MNIRKDVWMSEQTTFRIGGVVEFYCVPNNVDELIDSVRSANKANASVRILGRGSNLLVSNKGVSGFVYKLNLCCGELEYRGGGVVRAGSGVALQRFISFCISKGLYGNEYLASVPGTIGGAIAMNAGGGTHQSNWISNHLREVVVYDGEKLKILNRTECNFGFRSSIFQKESRYIILDAIFDLPKQNPQEGENRRRERMQWALKFQDLKYANAGSIFSGGSGRIFNLQRGWRLHHAGWSRKTGNWINNYGGASYREVMFLIRLSDMMSRFVRRKPCLEIRLWK